ncbi:uncharacterized protein LOC116161478 [Photinus pyralis]|uniref:uncharacterized protein LOC116161478 n=1 Tax=Photinus pyralis TaxID=7054 RepID=UPI0012676378|nr:uncharacterized protein LOC116161478 [Photinus pyralis]
MDEGPELDYKTQLLEQQRLITQLLQLQLRNNNASDATANISQHSSLSVPVPPPSEFTFQAEDWSEWKTRILRFKRIALANYSSEQQVDYLVGYVGGKAENILKSFHLSNEELKDFEIVFSKFDNYFVLKKNLVYERVRFLQRAQNNKESCDIFITDLTNLAQTCEWGTMEAEMIKLRIIAGLADNRLSVQLQAKPDDSLEEIIRKIRLAESLKKQQTVIRASGPNPETSTSEQIDAEVNYVHRGTKPKNTQQKYNSNATRNLGSGKTFQKNRDNPQPQEEKECRKCGLSPRHAFTDCPARNDFCRSCNRNGHWAAKCPSRNMQHQTNSKSRYEAKKVAAVEIKNNSGVSEGDLFFLGSIQTQCCEPWQAIVNVSGVPINFKIDTGADVTVLKAELLPKFKHTQLDSPQRPLLSASGDKINVKGTFEVNMFYKDRIHSTEVYVVENLHANLLSRDAIEALGMLSWASSITIQDNFPQLFQGIGDLGKQYTIELKQDSKPFSIATPRRVAIHLRDAVKENLEALEKQNIIFKVSQPTRWCAPMVAVPKKDGKVRICVDYSMLNKCVLTEKLVLPDISEALAQIGPNANFFSKIDATAGFYHVSLDPQSQLLTTFISPFGRWAFKKLPMGITSAPERFQREMWEALEGLDGIINVADDTLVFGSTREEHDRRLQLVLQRCSEKGIKLNKDKCIFGVKSLTFLGFIISNKGVGIDPQKKSDGRD